jgi:hypothetical protein
VDKLMKKWTSLFVAIGMAMFLHPLRAQKWENTTRLTWTARNSAVPVIALDSNQHIHLVWSDNTHDDNFELYYKKSTDGGTTWGAGKRLTWTPGYSIYPSIAIDSSNHIHVVWNCDSAAVNDDLYYKKSTDGGATWSPTKRLTMSSGFSLHPIIAIDSNDVIYVVFYDDSEGNDEIYCLRSKDGGQKWLKNKRITWNAGNSRDPAIIIDSTDRIHLAWGDETPGNYEVFYKMSTDYGATWVNNKRLTWNLAYSGEPDIALDSGNGIHIVFSDSTFGNAEIFYKKSLDGGISWSGKRLTWNAGTSSNQVIAVDSNAYIHVVWEDSSPGNREIYYARSQDGGMSWSKTRLTWNIGASGHPCITVQNLSNFIHVFWDNAITLQYEIYYRRGNQ